MAFTTVTVTGTFKDASGTAKAGSVVFTLSQPIENGDVIAEPTPIVAELNGSGQISVGLYSNVDLATSPPNTCYGVTELITGAQLRDYFVVIPTQLVETNGSTTNNSETVQLSSVTAAPWMVGCPITGSHIPANATITAVNQALNQLTISAPATATASGVALTIGATTIDLSTLMPGDVGWA